MIRKEECPVCKGNKSDRIKASDGTMRIRQCPECGGHGYKIRVSLPKQ